MQTIKLNLDPGAFSPTCHASQYDVDRTIRALLFDGLEEYTLTDETVILEVRKPDGNIVTESLTVTSGNKYVDIVTTQQMCAVAGKNLCEIRVQKNSMDIGTVNFTMEVQIDPTTGGIPSDSELNDLQTRVSTAVNTLFTGSTVTLGDKKINFNNDGTVTWETIS